MGRASRLRGDLAIPASPTLRTGPDSVLMRFIRDFSPLLRRYRLHLPEGAYCLQEDDQDSGIGLENLGFQPSAPGADDCCRTA